MNQFFGDLFECYPPNSKWKYYEQKALKVCILFKNDSNEPRVMTEYRTGFDGKTEIDPKTGKPKVLQPGETRYIAIEPSNKKFKYNEREWGAAAYSKDVESAERVWTKLRPLETAEIIKDVRKAGLTIPYYQIADTICSLYPSVADKKGGVKNVATILKRGLTSGDVQLGGLSNIVTVVKSNVKVLGQLVTTTDSFIKKQPIFPMGYGAVPVNKGSLIIIDLDAKLRLKDGTVKYVINGETYETSVIARIIDAPAVKGAMWTEMSVAKYKLKCIPSLVRKASKMLVQ